MSVDPYGLDSIGRALSRRGDVTEFHERERISSRRKTIFAIAFSQRSFSSRSARVSFAIRAIMLSRPSPRRSCWTATCHGPSFVCLSFASLSLSRILESQPVRRLLDEVAGDHISPAEGPRHAVNPSRGFAHIVPDDARRNETSALQLATVLTDSPPPR